MDKLRALLVGEIVFWAEKWKQARRKAIGNPNEYRWRDSGEAWNGLRAVQWSYRKLVRQGLM